MAKATFDAELGLHGKTATGIEVPPDVIEKLGGGKKPAVEVSFSGYSYRTTVGVMGGRHLIPVSAEHRSAAGVSAGDRLTVTVTLDEAPREVVVPDDLAKLLSRNATARKAFDALSPSGKKRHILAVEGAKTADTGQRRLDKVIAELTSGTA